MCIFDLFLSYLMMHNFVKLDLENIGIYHSEQPNETSRYEQLLSTIRRN